MATIEQVRGRVIEARILAVRRAKDEARRGGYLSPSIAELTAALGDERGVCRRAKRREEAAGRRRRGRRATLANALARARRGLLG